MPDNDIQTSTALTLTDQLTAQLKASINESGLKPGSKLPSEHELCRQYGVSRVTVRAALEQLVRDGLITKRQGKGAFVRPREFQESVFANGSFTDTCLRMGANPSTRIESIRERRAPAEIGPELLGSGEGGRDSVIELTRVRAVDRSPCIVEIDFFPLAFSFLLEEDLSNRSILKLIRERTGRVASGFEDQFRIAHASKLQAELLGCKLRSPLLDVKQVVSGADGGVIYVNHQYIDTERYVYAVKSSK